MKRFTPTDKTRRRFLDSTTGRIISRRQMEKIRHGGKTIEARSKERVVAGLKRRQAPRKGVLERVAQAVAGFFSSPREGVAKALVDAKTTKAAALKYAPPGTFNRPAREFAALDAEGKLVKVAVSIDEARRIGRARRRIGKRSGHIIVHGVDGSTYKIPTGKTRYERFKEDIEDTFGWDDITDDDTDTSFKFYKGELDLAA